MERLTTDQPLGILQTCLNLFYAKDGEAWVRAERPGPLYKDVRLFEFIRQAIRSSVDEDREYIADFSDEEIGGLMVEWFLDGNSSVEGVIGMLYTAAWAFAEIRERLKAYEDTGLELDEVERIIKAWDENETLISCADEIGGVSRLRELLQAEKDGRLVVLPCCVGTNVWVISAYGNQYNPPKEGCVTNFVFHDDELMYLEALIWMDLGDGKKEYGYRLDSFRKIVFLTLEEAEAALKGSERK